jgi:hypothetical protein
VNNELSHLVDGEAWKEFDKSWPKFAEDARNLRLGLATDGFNPFCNMNNSYSMWPVFVVPYNMPPWACMEESNFMMALLIPGSSSPSKDFDIFMEPLVEVLKQLWNSVWAIDVVDRKRFKLYVVVPLCIHDYPALSTLSGRVTKGYFSRVCCDKDPCSRRLKNKICYTGHHRFLPTDHPWRRKRADFDGTVENREKSEQFTHEELKQQLEKVKDVRPGKHPLPQGKNRKRESGQCWSRRVCLWDLPYWSSLKLAHNLDVRHIEKNICENLIGMLLKIVGKTKVTINARVDLEEMGVRSNLHMVATEDGESCKMPEAPYVLSKMK